MKISGKDCVDNSSLAPTGYILTTVPWLNRAKVQELKVGYFELGKTADETLANLKKKITKKTRVIAVPHVVCTIGQMQPIKEIVAFAKQENIQVFVDGAHGAGMLDL